MLAIHVIKITTFAPTNHLMDWFWGDNLQVVDINCHAMNPNTFSVLV